MMADTPCYAFDGASINTDMPRSAAPSMSYMPTNNVHMPSGGSMGKFAPSEQGEPDDFVEMGSRRSTVNSEPQQFIYIDPAKVRFSTEEPRYIGGQHGHSHSHNGHQQAQTSAASRLYRSADSRISWQRKSQSEKCKYIGVMCCALWFLILIIIAIILLCTLLPGYPSYDFEWLPPMTLTKIGVNEEVVKVSAQFDNGNKRVATRTHTTIPEDGWPFANVRLVMDFELRYTISIDERWPRVCFVFPIDDPAVDYNKLYAAASQTPLMQTRAADYSWRGDTSWVVDVVPDQKRQFYTQEDHGWDEDDFDTSVCGYGIVLKFSRAIRPAVPCQDTHCQEICLPEFGISSCAQMAITSRNCFWFYMPDVEQIVQENENEEEGFEDRRFNLDGSPVNRWEENQKMLRRMMDAFYTGRAAQAQKQNVQLNNMWVSAANNGGKK